MPNAFKTSASCFCCLCYAAPIPASPYISLAPAQIEIVTRADTPKPVMIDFRLGYTHQAHQLELLAMKSTQAGNINLLNIDAPSVRAILYRYSSTPYGSLKNYLILGASRVDIIASYPGSDNIAETYTGASFGIGFEEAFRSIPQLKMKFDWIKLYKGRELDINTINMGLRYEF